MSGDLPETRVPFPELAGPPDIPGHRRRNDLKDWMPGFNEAITELYRNGDVVLAEMYEKRGHMPHPPIARKLGEALSGEDATNWAEFWRKHISRAQKGERAKGTRR